MARDLKLQVILDAVDKVTKPLKRVTEGSTETAKALKASRDQLRQLERAQKDLQGFRQLKRQAAESGDALKEQRERVRELSRQLRTTEGDTAALNRERDAAIKKAQELSRKYAEQTDKAQRLKTSLRETHGITGKLAGTEDSLTRKMRNANAQITEQKERLRSLAEAQRRAQQASDQFHRGIGRTNAIRGAGMTGMATGGAGLYAGARLLAPGIEYGEQMSRVQAVTRLDKNDPRFAALKKQSRALGASTAFSASDVGRGQEFLGMAGFDDKAIRTAIPDMLNLALANKTDLGRTADISSNILSGFGLDPDQMGRVADVLTATTTRANVDLEMLGDSMKYVAPQAKAMGLSLEQASAMAGLLGNVGIQGSQAGTTLRAMMTRLAAPTGAAAGALKTLGVNAKDAQGDLRDVPKILADVAKATENMGTADRAKYLKQIFGEEPGAGMAELIEQQGAAGIEKFVEMYKNATGESARVAKTMTDNIGGDLKGLRSAWEEVGISITDTNEGPLRDLIQNVTAITRGVGNWIKANPELAGGIAKAAAGLAALVAVGGAFTIMLASILGPIVTVRYGLAMLGVQTGGLSGKVFRFTSKILPALGSALMWVVRVLAIAGRALLLNPIGLAVTAIAGAVYLIYRNWGAISSWFADRWADIKAAFSQGVGSVMRLLLNWNPLGLVYKGVIAVLRKLGVEVPESIATLGDAIVNGLHAAWGGITALWDWFKTAPGRAIDYVINLVRQWDLLGQLETKWTEAIDYLKSLPSRMFDAGKNVASGLADGIKSGASSVIDGAKNIAGGAVDGAKDLLGIHSPSRVFRQIGTDTVAGLNQGLDQTAAEPVKRVSDMTKRLRQAGAGIALGAATLPAAAAPQMQAPALPELPAIRASVERPKLPDLGTLTAPRIDVPQLPSLNAPLIETPRLPNLSALRTGIELPELPKIDTSAETIQFDRRPPLSAGGGQQHIDNSIQLGDIHITAGPGMDERQLAQHVQREVQRALADAQRQQAARGRSSMWDQE